MVGRSLSFWDAAYFEGLWLFVSGRVKAGFSLKKLLAFSKTLTMSLDKKKQISPPAHVVDLSGNRSSKTWATKMLGLWCALHGSFTGHHF